MSLIEFLNAMVFFGVVSLSLMAVFDILFPCFVTGSCMRR